MDDELPRSAVELSRELIVRRWREEEAIIERALSKGTPYRPKHGYEKGGHVVFPALEYLVGTVTDTRQGHNPEYESFRVIEVEFEDGSIREFAAELDAPHPLNSESQTDSLVGAGLLSLDDLVDSHASDVARHLSEFLDSDLDFVRLAGKWFPQDLLVEVNIGHLNLAEAVLDAVGGGPLPTEELLGDLELPKEVSPQLRVFSLNYALQEDERFDEVGPAGEVVWFLHSLEPAGVKFTPAWLQHEAVTYDPALPTSEMLDLEQELDDEWSDLEQPATVSEPVTVVLTCPHWRSGTLPLSSRLSLVFPTGRTHRIRFTLVDGDTGAEIPAWVVREGLYVHGLKEWYEEHDIPVGAYLDLERGSKPGTAIIRRRRRRPRREWVRVALPADGRLTFEVRKTLLSCQYAELMIITEEKPGAMGAVWTRTLEKHLSIAQLVGEIFPELAKLSPQGTVHATTLYSALNVAIRTPPGPMLAELVANSIYVPVGDNYWVLNRDASGRV